MYKLIITGNSSDNYPDDKTIGAVKIMINSISGLSAEIKFTEPSIRQRIDDLMPDETLTFGIGHMTTVRQYAYGRTPKLAVTCDDDHCYVKHGVGGKSVRQQIMDLEGETVLFFDLEKIATIRQYAYNSPKRLSVVTAGEFVKVSVRDDVAASILDNIKGMSVRDSFHIYPDELGAYKKVISGFTDRVFLVLPARRRDKSKCYNVERLS